MLSDWMGFVATVAIIAGGVSNNWKEMLAGCFCAGVAYLCYRKEGGHA